ncbi:hypothetical protein ACFYZ9_33805 [Streptomyces sp. NPDC001691]|uniref:hypothetical protein n=1 Tax=Streptomyces sp. NPDC001691 TaxID=3364600 RepID=UPI00367E96DD
MPMQPAVIKALQDWQDAFDNTQEAAAHAMRIAFPPLTNAPRPTGCCDVMLRYEQTGAGSGKVCIDQDGRGTIEFKGLPNEVIAEAVDDVFGIAWFDNADGPLEEAAPDTYYYDDESTSAEYEVRIGEEGTGTVSVAYIPVLDAAAVLDALTRAFDRQATAEGADGVSPGQ